MKIDDIDVNFKRKASADPQALDWYDRFEGAFRVHGSCVRQVSAPFCRLPPEIIGSMSEGVQVLAYHTAGMRLRFQTDSSVVAIKAVLSSSEDMSHMPRTGSSGFDLYVGPAGGETFRKVFMPDAGSDIVVGDCALSGKQMRHVTLNFPLYNGVKSLAVGLERGAAIRSAESYAVAEPIVYYGSSITHGGCASRPGNAYPAMLSRLLDADHINLGFSGNARGEPEMASVIAALQMSALVLDYDHNAPDPQHLRNTHRAFYTAVRSKQPKLPIIMASRPEFDIGNPDHIERRCVIFETYRSVREAGDGNAYFVDGERMFGSFLRDSCTVDGCHPNDLGFFRMAEAFYPTLATVLRQ